MALSLAILEVPRSVDDALLADVVVAVVVAKVFKTGAEVVVEVVVLELAISRTSVFDEYPELCKHKGVVELVDDDGILSSVFAETGVFDEEAIVN